MQIIKDYEILTKGNDIVITYSLSDCDSLKGLADVNIVAKERKGGRFDVTVCNLIGDELMGIDGLDFNTLTQMKISRSIIAGISEKTNDFEEASLVKEIKIIPAPKYNDFGSPLFDNNSEKNPKLGFTNADAFSRPDGKPKKKF